MNKRVLLKKRPAGTPQKTDFEVISEPLPTSLSAGEILVKVDYISVDPTQLVWISGARSYMPPVKLNDCVRAFGIGRIVQSNDPDYTVGSLVSGLFNWQEYCKIKAKFTERHKSVPNPSIYLSVLGMTGLTAYFSILDIGQAKKKQVVVISTAAGAVGSISVQIAKNLGCKVIGITSSEEKINWLKTMNIDGTINYKKENVAQALKTLCPEGVDVYLDNVGGSMLDAVLLNANKGARVILCGAIQGYTKKAQGLYYYPLAIAMSIKMKGFIIMDYAGRYSEGLAYLEDLYKKGKIMHKEDIVEGIENSYIGLQKLVSGDNIGKTIIKVSNDTPRL